MNQTVRVVLFFLLSQLSLQAQGQPFFPIKIQNKWGLINSEGTIVLQPIYEAIGEFKAHGYAVMQRAGGVGLLSSNGQEVVPPKYEDLKVLNAQLIAVRQEGQWQVVNLMGRLILAPGYERLKVLSDFYLAYEKGGKWGIVNSNGATVAKPAYQWIGPAASPDFFQIQSESGIGLINLDGGIVLPARYDEIRILDSTLLSFQKEGKWGLMNGCEEGKIEARFDGYERISSHFIRVFKDRRSLLYHIATGKLVTKKDYDNFYPFSAEYVVVKQQRMLGLVDLDGQEILSPAFHEIQPFSKSLFRVNRAGRWALAGEGNELVLPFEYDYIAPLKGPVCLVKKGGKAGAVNLHGSIIIEPIYDRIEFEAQQLKAYKDGQLSLFAINKEGQLADEQRFDHHFTISVGKKKQLSESIDGFQGENILKNFEWFYSPQDDLWGLRKLEDGSIQIEPQFDRIQVYKDLGFTLVGLEKTTMYDFERTTYRFDMVYGMVNNEAGLLVTEIDFLDLRLSDFWEGLPVARFISSNGRHGLINRIGKVLVRDFAFIGSFEDGLARASTRGRLSGNIKAEQHAIEPLSAYLNRHLSPNYRVDYTRYDESFEKEAALICEECAWGYLDTTGTVVIGMEYSFAEDLVNEVGIVGCNDKWGMVGKEGRVLIPCLYDDVDFLENTDNQIIRIYKGEEKYGLIDTLGHLRVDLVYDEIGSFRDGRLAVKRNGLWGFVDRNGLEVIPCRFHVVGDYSEGLAAVKVGRKWGFIDKLGQEQIPLSFVRVGNFKQGLAWFVDGGRFGYMNAAGKVVIPPIFEKANDFEGSVARVAKDLRYGLIDPQGNFILRPKYNLISEFDENGLARVSYGNETLRYGIIDKNGLLITTQAFREIRSFHEDRAAVKYKGGYGFIDAKGRLVIDAKYSKVSDFSEGKAAVQRDGLCGYIDWNGKELVELAFSKCLDFEDGKAVVYKGNRRAGLIDSLGRILIEPSINRLFNFSEGRGLVRDENYRFYYITEQANLYDGYYQKASQFRHGVAVVQVNDRWGIINQKGIEIIPPKYDKIDQFENGYAKVRIKGFNGLSNLKGEMIVQPDYEYISYAGEGLFRVEQGDKIGYFDVQGRWVWGLTE